MKKIIQKMFKIKIMSFKDYDQLLNAIAMTGNMVRKYTSRDSYTNYGQSYKVSANDLSNIHCVENCVWEDIKGKLNV